MAENLIMCHFPVAMPAFKYYNVKGLRARKVPASYLYGLSDSVPYPYDSAD
jgi:hypothetical protein